MQIYLVGGAVRDALLGYPVYDRDWVVVGATPALMLADGYKPVGSDFPVFIHPRSGEEYALARTERKSGKGYAGFTWHASPDVSLEEDLIRRDLTINAMAQDDQGVITDPYQGQQDLQAKLLRHVSPAFEEDPLRVLRVARFAARYAHLGFTVADETLALMQRIAATDELAHLTAERVWKEFERALAEPSPLVFLQVLADCHGLATLLPTLTPLFKPPAPQLDSQLQSLPEGDDQARQRFALLLSRATEQLDTADALAAIEQACQALRSPNGFRDLALHCRQWHSALARFNELPGAQRLALVQGLDLLRRPQRLDAVLACSRALHGEVTETAAQGLPLLLNQLNSLSPQALMAEGFKGKALGDELKARQLQTCQSFTL